jgi:hypothetical protein
MWTSTCAVENGRHESQNVYQVGSFESTNVIPYLFGDLWKNTINSLVKLALRSWT